jgi:hypothetical protein
MLQTTLLSEVLSGEKIPIGKLAYFRARLTNHLHSLVLEKFLSLKSESGLTRAELARRIGRKPEQVTRWFGSPGNWTLETVSDLLMGMGCELDPQLKELATHLDSQVLAHSNAFDRTQMMRQCRGGLFQLNDGSLIIVFQENGSTYAISIPLGADTQIQFSEIASPSTPWQFPNHINSPFPGQHLADWRTLTQNYQINQFNNPLSTLGAISKQSYLLGQSP